MGDPKKRRKKFETPKKMWEKAKVEERGHLTKNFGLKNKKEVWKAETILRKKRQDARRLLALPVEERKKREKELLNSLKRLGVLQKNASLDDVLSLKTESLLERRLQSIAWKHGLSATVKQARQLITHGHIAINGKKVSSPSYLVKKNEEPKVEFLDKSLALKIKKEMKKKKPRGKKPEKPQPLGALKESAEEKKSEGAEVQKETEEKEESEEKTKKGR